MNTDLLVQPEGSVIELLAVKFSAALDQIAPAFVAAQAMFENYRPDSTAQVKSDKGNYSYNYAKLPDVIGATRPSLNAQGIAVLQPVVTEGQKVTVQTLLLHKSGQWIANTLVMTGSGSTPQVLGSTITYARRYALQALLCVAPDMDDDGAGASARDEHARQHGEAEGYIAKRVERLAIDSERVADLAMELSNGAQSDWRALSLENKRRLFAELAARFEQKVPTEPTATTATPATNGATHTQANGKVKPTEEIPPAGSDAAVLRAWFCKRLSLPTTTWKKEHVTTAIAEVTKALGLAAGTITAKNLGEHIPMYRDAAEKAATMPQESASDAQTVAPATESTPAAQETFGMPATDEPPDLRVQISDAIAKSGWSVEELESTTTAISEAVSYGEVTVKNWQQLGPQGQERLLEVILASIPDPVEA